MNPQAVTAMVKDGIRIADEGCAIIKDIEEKYQLDREGLVKRIKTMVALGDQMADKGQVYYREAGAYLRQLKTNKPRGISWDKYLKDCEFGFGKSRADELIAIFEGRTTVEETRAHGRKRQTKSRAERPLRHGRATDINGFQRELFDFIERFGERVTAWLAEHPDLDQEAKQTLLRAIWLSAEQLNRLAQTLDGRPL